MEQDLFYLKIKGIKLSETPIGDVAAIIQAFGDLLGANCGATLKAVKSGSVLVETFVPTNHADAAEKRTAQLQPDRTDIDPFVTKFLEKVRSVGGKSTEIGRGKSVIARFDQPEEIVTKKIVIKQYSEVQGKLVSLTGEDETKHAIILHATGKWHGRCTEDVGKILAGCLWTYVKLGGQARWLRDHVLGTWNLDYINITSVEPLDSKSIDGVFKDVSEIKGFHPERFDDPQEFMKLVRG